LTGSSKNKTENKTILNFNLIGQIHPILTSENKTFPSFGTNVVLLVQGRHFKTLGIFLDCGEVKFPTVA
jgi:hypothetical protein